MKHLKFLMLACLLSTSLSAFATPQNRVPPPSIQKIMRTFFKDNRINVSRIWILSDEVRSVFGYELSRERALYPKVRFQVGQELFQCTYIAGELSAHIRNANEYILMGFRVYDCRNQTKGEDVNFSFNDTFTDGARFFANNTRFAGLTWDEKYELLGGGTYGAEGSVNQIAASLTTSGNGMWSSDEIPQEHFIEIDATVEPIERDVP